MSDAIAAEALRVWGADPVRMVRDLWNIEPDRWQQKVLRLWADPAPKKRIAMQACAGPGKSAVEAWCGWHGLLTRARGDYHPVGACVSMTGENLKNGLWHELAVWRGRSPILRRSFEQTSESIFEKSNPLTWYLNFRSFAKSADQEAQGRTLSGLHSPAIFYLIDESGSVPPSVGRAARQGLANCEWGRILQGGNPVSHDSLLYEAATLQAHLWDIVRVTADPDDPDRSPRLDIEEARESIALYGRTDAWVMAYVLGEFPNVSLDALLGPDDLAKSQGKSLHPDVYNFQQKRLGIDVARFGGDSTVIFPRQGKQAFKPVELKGARSEVIAARIIAAKQKWGSECEMIDDTGGWGAGAFDACRLGGVDLLPINSGHNADDRRYFNKRTENNFRAAEWIKAGGATPQNGQFVREACAVRYWFDKGVFRVLEKDQMKKALNGKSPDYWDAFCLTFSLVEMPASDAAMTGVPGFSGGNHVKTEWDPYREER
jgi:phage terminase large subunit